MRALAALAGTFLAPLVVVSAGLTAIVLTVHSVRMLAVFDGAFTSGAIAFSIRHGTDSLGCGCPRLECEP